VDGLYLFRRHDEWTGGLRKLHEDVFNELFCLLIMNIFRMIKSSKIRWQPHVTRMMQKRNAYLLLAGNRESKKESHMNLVVYFSGP
jgi:hypothetical protein